LNSNPDLEETSRFAVVQFVKKLFLLSLLVLLAGCASVEDTGLPGPSASAQQSLSPTEAADPLADDMTEADQEADSEQESAPENTEESDQGGTTASSAPVESSASDSDPEPTQTPTSKPSESESASEPKLTLAAVAANNSNSSCWVVIEGLVYDLTPWISKHPGGAGAILGLCGSDGTEQFAGKHGGQATPASALKDYLLGELQR
jgi:cytochrome b involved in lipid metabolism